jgi:hypothetical protein
MAQAPSLPPEAVLSASEQLLRAHSDFYTLWNLRRNALQKLADGGTVTPAALLEVELALTQTCLQKHPKSYWTWNHVRRLR